VTVRVLYHREPDGWWPKSPDIDGWTVAGESFDEVRQLVVDGVTFASRASPRSAARASRRSASRA
jgi:hypothetical protein